MFGLGVDVNLPDCTGATPLMWAVAYESAAAWQSHSIEAPILENASNDSFARLQIHYLQEFKELISRHKKECESVQSNNGVLEALWQHKGLDVNARDASGSSLLHIAARTQHTTLLGMLLARNDTDTLSKVSSASST